SRRPAVQPDGWTARLAAVRPTAAAKAAPPARPRRAGSWGRRAATALPHPCAAARPPYRLRR
ncbi:MAG: hypothetical protein Q7R35_12040, partial [Elusimicrobiota bacterium]|nr:hypothetical protein [Elusimicrobiota bacterium]